MIHLIGTIKRLINSKRIQTLDNKLYVIDPHPTDTGTDHELHNRKNK